MLIKRGAEIITKHCLCTSCRKIRRKMNDGTLCKLTLEEELDHPLVNAVIRNTLEEQLKSRGGCEECIERSKKLFTS